LKTLALRRHGEGEATTAKDITTIITVLANGVAPLKKEEVEATWINHRLWRSLAAAVITVATRLS
jgi:hypothetical protein